MKTGFDNQKYIKMQSERILERVQNFGDKLYLEFGGKLFDDYHASRVLPGFEPDSKLKMLLKMKDQAEIVIAISADAIEQNKKRGDLGITYDLEVLRLIDSFTEVGLYVGSVVITKYAGQPAADAFRAKLSALNIKNYLHYPIEGYPSNISLIVSDDGYGKNDYIETSRPLVVITAPGPGSGKMATCLSQLYHENKRGIKAGYAKFETFPIWNLPLSHPVNIAYEAATADLSDVNMIDPYHMEAYGITTVNYNRDVEIFPVLNAIFTQILGQSPYKSPTDMGVNMAGYCITDDAACIEASKQEIIRRYYAGMCDLKKGIGTKETVYKLELLMKQMNLSVSDRPVIAAAMKREETTGHPGVAIELPNGKIISGKTTDLMGPSAAALINSLKELAGIDHKVHLVSKAALEPIQTIKTDYFGSHNPRLHTDEILIALSVSAASNPQAKLALEQLRKLRNCEVHSSVLLSTVDERIFKKLGMNLTCEPKYETNKKYHN